MNTRQLRRALLGVAAVAALSGGFLSGSAEGVKADTLADVRSAGVIRAGLANQPPYSSLNPDGTIGGFVPTLTQRIFEKIGVSEVEGFVSSYGELIPGLQAGRWDMIAASFRLTKERCAAVNFSDPVTFDGGALAFDKGASNAPTSVEDVATSGATVGILQGSYLLKVAAEAGVADDKISQFPNNPALIDGLLTDRVQYVLSTNNSLKELQKARDGAFEIAFPLPDDQPKGSAPAFRKDDTALHAAFQEGLRALRDSGELDELRAEFGFDAPPAELASLSGEEACARLQ